MMNVFSPREHGRARRLACDGGVTARRLGCWCLLMVMLAGVPARGVTINILFNPINSDQPNFDTNGQLLVGVMNAAADIWEGIIQDPWTLNITTYWDDLSDANGTLGLHQNLNVSLDRPTDALIRFDTQINSNPRQWYFDQTPFNHDEFTLQQTVFSGLTGNQQNNWYNGSTPNVFEEGYRGGATGTAPAAAQNGFDLLSVALHEIGHALGLTQNVAADETSDSPRDYDVDPNYVGGLSMGIAVNANNNRYHLAAGNSLMFPNTAQGTRTLPSMTDILAVAAAPDPDNREWVSLNLPRRNFLGGSDLNSSSGWIGGKPLASHDAYVRNNGVNPPFATATASLQVLNLFVLEGSIVNTSNQLIQAVQTTTIGGSGGSSFIRVQTNGELDTNDLVIASGGTLRMLGGFGDIQGDVTINSGGALEGYGTVLVDDSLTNDGVIRGTDGQTLLLTTAGSGTWDLDGASGNGNIQAISGDLRVIGSLASGFSGNATVGAVRLLRIDSPWTLNSTGDLTLDGTTTDAAKLGGGLVQVNGDILVDKLADIDAQVQFNATADVSVPDSNDSLRLNAPTTFNGGDYTGNGSLVQNTDITVASNTTIDLATYDWGNSGIFATRTTTINAGATFTIDSGGTGTAGNDYRGVMLIKSGVLDVSTGFGWTLPASTGSFPLIVPGGVLNLNNTGGGTPIVRGQPITLGGRINANFGAATIESDLTVMAGSTIDVGFNADLTLSGHTTLGGGTITGDGELTQGGDITVNADTTITTEVYDWGNSTILDSHTTTIDPGVKLTVFPPSGAGSANNAYRGFMVIDSGTLDVKTPGAWTLPAFNLPLSAGVLTLEKSAFDTPTVTGQPLDVFGRINMDASNATLESIVTRLHSGSDVEYLRGGDIQLVSTFEVFGGTVDHGVFDGRIRTSPNATFNWGALASVTVAGAPGGSLTYDFVAGTSVGVSLATPTLTIDPGATVNVIGAVDPFTDTATGTRHINIVNNSTASLHIDGVDVALGSLNGVGHTVVEGAQLSSDIVVQSRVVVASDARLLLSLSGGTISTTDLDNRGGLLFAGDAEVFGALINTGAVELPSNSTVFFNGRVQHLGTGFTVPSSSKAVFNGEVTGDKRFDGGGLFEFNAEFKPGASPGRVDVFGDATFGAASTFEAEIGGLDAGIDHDLVRVTQDLTLAGTLDIKIVNGFEGDIVPFDEFTVLTWGTRVGDSKFDTVLFMPPPSIPGLSFLLEYNDVNSRLELTADALGGDANLDGTVDLTDLTILAINFETPFEQRRWRKADFNNDGLTNLSDLTILAINFGSSVSSGSFIPGVGADPFELAAAVGISTAAVPEPGTVGVLAALAGPGLLVFRRRQSRQPLPLY